MPRNDGPRQRARILRAAEGVFSRVGFHGASISEIAHAAGVNKALLYYYFKSKDDIVASLFRSTVAELDAHVGSGGDTGRRGGKGASRKSLQRELLFLSQKRKILAVMLMEALKSESPDDSLFRCAEAVFRSHVPVDGKTGARNAAQQRLLVDEFFTGFLPLVGFTVLRERWCHFFSCDTEKASAYFREAFEKHHIHKD